jgi:hypothetical protein
VRSRPGAVWLLAFALLAGAWSWVGSGTLGSDLWVDPYGRNVWFESDPPKIVEILADRAAEQYRSNLHPLFTLAAYPPVFAMRRVAGLSFEHSVRLFVALVAAAWGALLYLLLRLVLRRPLDAALMALLGLTSASAVCWLPVAERYPLGSVSILAMLVVLALGPDRVARPLWWALASGATLAVTITNWMVGLAALVAVFPLRRAAAIAVGGLVLVVGCWGVERLVFPGSRVPFGHSGYETTFTYRPSPLRVAQSVGAFAVHTMVLPRAVQVPDPRAFRMPGTDRSPPDPGQLVLQASPPGSGGWRSGIAALAWVGLLVLGVRALWRRGWRDRLSLTLALALAGQLGLHVLYGEEAFLYSMHWLPMLVLVAAAGLEGRARQPGLALATVVLLAGGSWNVQSFVELARKYGSEHFAVLRAMSRRPAGPWPHARAHVPLSALAAPDSAKAYLEPGGSLSPGERSFGISLWVKDRSGAIVATSDEPASPALHHRFLARGDTIPPVVQVETAFYRAAWRLDTGGRWQLDVGATDTAHVLELVVRSVGPAGGPIPSLRWDGTRLAVGSRWTLAPEPLPGAMAIGEEGDSGWTARFGGTAWTGRDGWGYARLALRPGAVTHLTLAPVPPNAVPGATVLEPAPTVDLPDPRFEESLRAGVAHLATSLVGDEPRSGDPLALPIPSARAGAYAAVALARTGQLGPARKLADYLAAHDYYGAAGAEADAPGLAVWALAEVSGELGDSSYTRSLWPHFRHKAGLIESLLRARDTVRAVPPHRVLWPYTGGALGTIVAAPAKGGLIVGRVDTLFPTLYASAISARGLADAAGIARALGYGAEARRWSDEAAGLVESWSGAVPPSMTEEAAYIFSAWPAELPDTGRDGAGLRDAALRRWVARWDSAGGFLGEPRPSQPARELGEAHTWLAWGDPTRAWVPLRWLWDHQSIPGLYTWWDSDRPIDSYGRWDNSRGWADSSDVTPSYLATAEMLLLQLDILGSVRQEDGQPTAVLGAGLPRNWLHHPVGVTALRLAGRRVDWEWDGSVARVTVHGPPLRCRLAPTFPAGARIAVTYAPPL